MPALPRIRLWRIVRFASGFALDLLIPDVVEKVYKACRGFYQSFLVIDLNERVELFKELDAVSAADEAELIDAILAAWAEQMPSGCALPGDARQVAERMVKSLRAAKSAAASGTDAGEALRVSLNTNLLGPRKLDAIDPPAIPGYTFLGALGSGGFGVVVLARHEPTDTLRAVKFGPLTDPARFKQEIELARRLNSPHLVKYFESGVVGSQFWIAMEYLGHTTLGDLMARSDFRSRPFLLPQIGEQLLAGLADLHAMGMIHRDLKPANVMVDDQFRLKLIDFGLAKPVDKLHGYASTTTGTLIGTAVYMSPEQMKGAKDLSPASDVYAAGSLIYELFVGRPPHHAENFADVVLKAYTQSIPFDLPALPPELRPVLEQCLKREAGGRYPDARRALEEYRKVAPEVQRRLRHEFYKLAWVPVLERGLLEKFVAEVEGALPEDAVAQFEQRVREEGLPECDPERLAEILPRVFAAQHRVWVAEEATLVAKQRFAAEATRLNAAQIQARAEQIRQLEAAATAAQARVTEEIRRELADEVSAWESLAAARRQAAAEADAAQQEDLRRRAEAREKRRATTLVVGKYLGLVLLVLGALAGAAYGVYSGYQRWFEPDQPSGGASDTPDTGFR